MRTPEGGVHERGFKAALTRVANDYAAKLGVIKNRDKEAFKAEVIQQGLVAAISVKLKDPQFEGQTKNKLNNAPVEGIVRSVVIEGLKEWFEARPAQAQRLAQEDPGRSEAGQSPGRRGAARADRARSATETVDVDTSKFARRQHDRPRPGRAVHRRGPVARRQRQAGPRRQLSGHPGPARQADQRDQRPTRAPATEQGVRAAGVGHRHRRARRLQSRQMQVHKIIIMTDADVDGGHIRALLLALFYQEMPGLIEGGRVYVAMPPLYSVKWKSKINWLFDDEALRRVYEPQPRSEKLADQTLQRPGRNDRRGAARNDHAPAPRACSSKSRWKTAPSPPRSSAT